MRVPEIFPVGMAGNRDATERTNHEWCSQATTLNIKESELLVSVQRQRSTTGFHLMWQMWRLDKGLNHWDTCTRTFRHNILFKYHRLTFQENNLLCTYICTFFCILFISSLTNCNEHIFSCKFLLIRISSKLISITKLQAFEILKINLFSLQTSFWINTIYSSDYLKTLFTSTILKSISKLSF